MRTVQLVDAPQRHEHSRPTPAWTQFDCDCACPVTGSHVPTLDMPAVYALELTSACNNRCAGCSNVFPRDAAPAMPLDHWRRVLAKIAPHAARLKLTGGEPTLHPNFAQIVEAVEAHGVRFTLFTNGRWRSPQAILDLLRGAQTCAGLLVSLHGAEPAAHDAFAGVAGAFDETLGNIRRAVAAGLPVSISCVLTRHNLDQIGAVCDLAARLGVVSTVFNRYIGAPLSDVSLGERQLARAVERVNARRSAGEPVRFGTPIPRCFAGPTSPGCLAGVAYCTIDPWGNLRPCSHVAWSAGSILDGALHDAWHAPAMQQWRGLSPDACDGCASAPVCRGGCRAEAVLNGLPQDPLIRRAAPIDEAGPPLRLYRFAQAGLACKVRPQRFGYLLFSEDRMAAAVEAQAPVLDALRADCSLDAVARRHGQAALDWVGELYAHNLVTLAW